MIRIDLHCDLKFANSTLSSRHHQNTKSQLPSCLCMVTLLHFFSGFVIALVPRSLHPQALVVGLSLGKTLTKPLRVINQQGSSSLHFKRSVCKPAYLLDSCFREEYRTRLPFFTAAARRQAAADGSRETVSPNACKITRRECVGTRTQQKKAQHGKFISRSEHSEDEFTPSILDDPRAGTSRVSSAPLLLDGPLHLF